MKPVKEFYFCEYFVGFRTSLVSEVPRSVAKFCLSPLTSARRSMLDKRKRGKNPRDDKRKREKKP